MQLLAAAIARFNVVSGDDSGPLVRKDLSKQGKLCFSPQRCSFKTDTIRRFLSVIKIDITVIKQLAFELNKLKWVLHTHTHKRTFCHFLLHPHWHITGRLASRSAGRALPYAVLNKNNNVAQPNTIFILGYLQGMNPAIPERK